MRRRTERDYELRVERVLRHIVRHLDEPLTSADLAAVAAFSRFHFDRIFRGMTGETVADLIRRLRLERAAARLRETRASITSIALDAGFESGEAFARAFKRCAGVTPSAYRNTWPPPSLAPAHARVRYRPGDDLISLDPVSGGLPMDVSIETRPATAYAYIRHTGAYPDIGPCFEQLFAWASAQGALGPATQCFSLSYDDPDSVQADALRSDACVSLDEPGAAAGNGVQTAVLPAGRYAVHRHVGAYDGISDVYRRMFGQWLPASGESVADLPCMEIYLNNALSSPAEKLETLLCVPLQAPQ